MHYHSFSGYLGHPGCDITGWLYDAIIILMKKIHDITLAQNTPLSTVCEILTLLSL